MSKSLALAETSNYPRKDVCKISSGYRPQDIGRISSGYCSQDIVLIVLRKVVHIITTGSRMYSLDELLRTSSFVHQEGEDVDD